MYTNEHEMPLEDRRATKKMFLLFYMPQLLRRSSQSGQYLENLFNLILFFQTYSPKLQEAN